MIERMRAPVRNAAFGLAVAVLSLLPRAALACAVCSGGQKEEVSRAYFWGAIAMSVIPLLAAGSLLLWLWRRSRVIAEAAAPAIRREARLQPAPGRG